MLIDWTTVVFQLVNFLILMILLKKFLFGRIVRAMDEREEEIARRLADAEEMKKSAEDARAEYTDKTDRFEQERQKRMETVEKEVQETRRELMQKSREDVEAHKMRWKKNLVDERDSFLRHLRDLAAGQVFTTSRRILADLADRGLEELAVERFLQHLAELPDDERKSLSRRLGSSSKTATVESGFEVGPPMKSRITEAVRDALDPDIEVTFETKPDLIMGVVLRGEGYKLAWSAADYLEDLEKLSHEALSAGVEVEHAGDEAGASL